MHRVQVQGYSPKTKKYDIAVQPTSGHGDPYVIQHTLDQFMSFEASLKNMCRIGAPFPQRKTFSNPSVGEHKKRMEMLTNWLNEVVHVSDQVPRVQMKMFEFLDVADVILARKAQQLAVSALEGENEQGNEPSGGGGKAGGEQHATVLDFGALAATQMDYTTATVDKPSSSPGAPMSRARMAKQRASMMQPPAAPQQQQQQRRHSAVPKPSAPPVLPTEPASPGVHGQRLVAAALNSSFDGAQQQLEVMGFSRERAAAALARSNGSIEGALQLLAPPQPPQPPSEEQKLAQELGVDLDTARRILQEQKQAKQKQRELAQLQEAQRRHDAEQAELARLEAAQGAVNVSMVHDERFLAEQQHLASLEAQQGGPLAVELLPQPNSAHGTKTISVTVPDGAHPGQKLRVKAGTTTVLVTVPAGAKPGNKLKIKVHNRERSPAPVPAPAPAPVPVVPVAPVETLITVPNGVRGGDQVYLDLADGRNVMVTLPAGCQPGQKVSVVLPL